LLISLSIAFISVAPEARKSFTCMASLLISFRLKSARPIRRVTIADHSPELPLPI
jgi:hypothetical protein